MQHRTDSPSLRSSLPLPLFLAGAWALMVVLFEVVKPDAYSGPGLCMFRNVTGVPCPTCGSTRAVLAIGRGQFVEAFVFNPFLIIAILALGAWMIIQILPRANANSEPSMKGSGWIVWTVIAVLFVANWIFLITTAD